MKTSVKEVEFTVQGEGPYAGRPTVMIRMTGCTVGCTWCDTKRTWNRSEDGMTVQQVIARTAILVNEYFPHQNVQDHLVFTITGGEPMEYPGEVRGLSYALESNWPLATISVETSGVPEFTECGPVRFTLSPKPHSLPHHSWDPLIRDGKVHLKLVLDNSTIGPLEEFLVHACPPRLDYDRPVLYCQPLYVPRADDAPQFDHTQFYSALQRLWSRGWRAISTLQMHKHLMVY